ncbi:MAG TPA: DNA (cytosine-5-)-methyltransferase [Opitutaceae bacterium]|jgi:DNA (cytosine-5)-methyltransferase 1
MPSNLLIRGISPEVGQWIESEKASRRVSKNELLLTVLKDAAAARQPEPTLFDFAAQQATSTPTRPTAIPFRFVDLFAGIGGLRLGLQRAGGTCVFTSEWDRYSQKTYKAWYGDDPHGDITKIAPESIPDHDVLAAGFPCQPFSIAGVSKKISLGRAHGFKDAAQGTLFFHVVTIAEIKRPPVLLLENVKNLLSHDGGKTWKVIHANLQDLGYKVFHKVIDAKHFVPQHRERIFIVCFDPRVFGENPPFQFPELPEDKHTLKDILDPSPDPKYTLSDHLWRYLQAYADKHREKGNGFGFGLTPPEKISRTLSARYYKDGSEILIPQARKNPRRLSPREAARLMGFPDELPIVVSDTQAYKQFGNAVVPLVSEAVAKQIVEVFAWHLRNRGCLFRVPEALSA